MDHTPPNPSSPMIIDGRSSRLLILSLLLAKLLLQRLDAGYKMPRFRLLFLFYRRRRRFYLSLRLTCRRVLLCRRELVAQRFVFSLCVRQLFEDSLQFGFAVLSGFDQSIAAFDMFVVTADGFVRDLPRVFVVTQDIGDGERSNVQSALVTHMLDTQQPEQDKNTDRCNEAVLEIRIAGLIEYRPFALLPYRAVIDVARVEMVQRLFVPRIVSLGLLPRLAVSRQ